MLLLRRLRPLVLCILFLCSTSVYHLAFAPFCLLSIQMYSCAANYTFFSPLDIYFYLVFRLFFTYSCRALSCTIMSESSPRFAWNCHSFLLALQRHTRNRVDLFSKTSIMLHTFIHMVLMESLLANWPICLLLQILQMSKSTGKNKLTTFSQW